jgi:hypothetical protein
VRRKVKKVLKKNQSSTTTNGNVGVEVKDSHETDIG